MLNIVISQRANVVLVQDLSRDRREDANEVFVAYTERDGSVMVAPLLRGQSDFTSLAQALGAVVAEIVASYEASY